MDFKWIFFIFAGLGCAFWILSNANPIRSLMIFMTFFYVFPTGWIFYEYTGILLVDLPMIAALIFAFANGQRVRLFFKEITPSFLVMLGWMLIATTRAVEPGWAIAEISKWIRAYLIFVCLANFIKTEKDLRPVLLSVLAGFALEVFVGLYQWRHGYLGLAVLGERPWRPEWWRAYGTFYVPSYFSNYLIMIMPIVLRLLIFYRPPKRSETWYYGVLMASSLAVLYATYSRGPWLSFLAVVALMLLFTFFKSRLRPKVKWPIAAGIAFALVFGIKYWPRIVQQFGEERKMAAMSRIYLGQVALRLIKDNSLFGVGPANYELASPRYVIPIKEYPAEHLSERVHNSYLLIASENGVPGFLAFIFILGQMSLVYLRMFRSPHRLHLNLAVGGVMALGAICISFTASPDIHNEHTLNQIYLIAGLVFACQLMDRRALAILRNEQLRKRQKGRRAQPNQDMSDTTNHSLTTNGHSRSTNETVNTPTSKNLGFASARRPPERSP